MLTLLTDLKNKKTVGLMALGALASIPKTYYGGLANVFLGAQSWAATALDEKVVRPACSEVTDKVARDSI